MNSIEIFIGIQIGAGGGLLIEMWAELVQCMRRARCRECQGQSLRGPTVALVLGCAEIKSSTKIGACGWLLMSIEFLIWGRIGACGGLSLEMFVGL